MVITIITFIEKEVISYVFKSCSFHCLATTYCRLLDRYLLFSLYICFSAFPADHKILRHIRDNNNMGCHHIVETSNRYALIHAYTWWYPYPYN